jgi:1-acyl-sn-glycerol-3-phosphate acyltransferase
MAEKILEPVTDKRSILYELIRFLAKIVFGTVMPVRCYNRERLDAEAPYVLIANHQHALDPLAMAIFIPGRQICFLGKKELGKNKLANRLLTSAHGIFVGRGEADMAAMRNCMKAIRMKKILLIFPEGTRHHKGQMEEIQSGTSLIAMRSGAPIVPVYIDRELGFFRKTNLYCGEPIPYSDLAEKGINAETCEELNERFRETFRKMIAETESASKKN